MPNSIALFKNYVHLLDEVYKLACLTSDLDGNPDLVAAGANANELIIPKLSMQGLADYSRNSGYVSGDVTLTNETVKCNFDRGRMFAVDAMDDAETAGIAYGRLAGEFIRTKVAPELDAFRFAAYAGVSGISKVASGATLSSGADVIAALRAAINKMDEDEVPYENRYLYITPTLLGLIQDLDTTKSREVLARFAKVVAVPQTRFYTAIEQLNTGNGGYQKYTTHYKQCLSTDTGALKVVASNPTTGQIAVASVTPLVDSSYTPAADDYVLAVSGCDTNFMVMHKDALIQFSKHIAPKVVTPEANQDSDAWKFGYRHVAIADAYENKVAGIYLHHKAS